MEHIYLILVVFLLLLAFFDLIVGVSNDASNFLNSAIGSKVASFRTIIIIASLGIVIGATFSSGMMDIARNGIFNPSKFYFNEIIWIFVGVMVADILLLNIFNNLGLPTSTTVSIVFDLLGASLAMAIYKLTKSGEALTTIGEYINTGKALAIISGILISVVVAFISGSVVQYLVRLLFSFDYRKTYKYFGSLFGGIAITAITYFMIMKGAKGASFMKPEYVDWIDMHHWQLLLGSFLGWTVILQALMWLFQTNVLKIIILAGTFALAMAFAGNDLVNFIGVPLAGLESYKLYVSSGIADSSLVMDSLNSPVKTPTIFLLIAGLVMAGTLMFSRRARKVIDTTLNLSRQGAGEEQFDSTLLARTLVRGSLNVSSFFERVIPKQWQKKIDKRFEKKQSEEDIAFDQVRASVNLVVASILIASATSLKLPLSTTYVTFMVAMGSSLADRAWDRETAVYRITGVITVIGGWFVTAISALTMACIITLFLIWGRGIALVVCILVVGYVMFHSMFASNKKKDKEQELKKKKETILLNAKSVTSTRVFEECNKLVVSYTIASSKLYYLTLSNFLANKRKALKGLYEDIAELNKQTKEIKSSSYKVITKLKGDAIEASHFFVQVVDDSREIANSVLFIYKPAFEYLDNNHTPFVPVQVVELTELNDEMSVLFNMILHTLKNRKYDNTEDIRKKKVMIIKLITELQRKQLKRIKKQEVSTRNSVLYLNILTESKNMALFAASLVKSNRNFYNSVNQKKIKNIP